MVEKKLFVYNLQTWSVVLLYAESKKKIEKIKKNRLKKAGEKISS